MAGNSTAAHLAAGQPSSPTCMAGMRRRLLPTCMPSHSGAQLLCCLAQSACYLTRVAATSQQGAGHRAQPAPPPPAPPNTHRLVPVLLVVSLSALYGVACNLAGVQPQASAAHMAAGRAAGCQQAGPAAGRAASVVVWLADKGGAEGHVCIGQAMALCCCWPQSHSACPLPQRKAIDEWPQLHSQVVIWAYQPSHAANHTQTDACTTCLCCLLQAPHAAPTGRAVSM